MDLLNYFTLIVPVWLELRDVSKLDLAFTNKSLRVIFFHILESKECIFRIANNECKISSSSFILWLRSRRIRLTVKILKLELEFEQHSLKLQYLNDSLFEKIIIDSILNVEILEINDREGIINMDVILSLLKHFNLLKHIQLNGNFMRKVCSSMRMKYASLFGELCDSKQLSLKLYQGGGFNDLEIDCILTYCPNLQTLTLSYVDGDGGSTLIKSVAKHCVSITHLDLGWHRYVTNQDVINLLQVCSKLKSLSLKCAFDISDIVLHEIAASNYLTATLEELNIMRCSQLTDAGLIHLIESCPNLHTLHVTLEGAISEDSIEHCMVFFPRISFILCESNMVHSLH